MYRAARLSVFVCAMALPMLSSAQSLQEDYTACTRLQDDRTRLTCYDKLKPVAAPQAAAPAASKADAGKYTFMTFEDLTLDVDQLSGKRVAVEVYIQGFGGITMIRSQPRDMNTMTVNTDHLSREDRKQLLTCKDLRARCHAIVYGLVGRANFDISQMTLERIDWK
ncbi:hypothetical protein [Bordetella genomosp. 1]|uniref:Uncharacterized protein n=1 Tax=Bordetella genomosp. 1 TaxID=1395607 RepID=A0ABX4F5F9_9BORD|nr:hypothetical protein [Bordetella genomosp. 1]OZI69014.1 hypothetical protein CAL27_06045 [Bordetella genomosp. 1]